MKEKKSKSLKNTGARLSAYAGPLIRPVCVALVFAAAGAVLTILGPNQLGKITDYISESLYGAIDMGAIARIGIVLACIYLASALFTYIQHYIMATVTLKLSKQMRGDLSRKINRVPRQYFGTTSHGDILSRMTNDVATVQQALSNSLPSIISAAAQFIGCLIMMFITEWRMACAAVAVTLLGVAAMALIMSRSQKYFVARQKSLGELNGYIEEMYSGHDVVRISRAEAGMKARFAGLNHAVYDANWHSQFLSGVMQPMTQTAT